MAARSHPAQAIALANSNIYLAISDALFCVSPTTRQILAKWKAPAAAPQKGYGHNVRAGDIIHEEGEEGDAEEASPPNDGAENGQPEELDGSVDVQMKDGDSDPSSIAVKRKRSPSVSSTLGAAGATEKTEGNAAGDTDAKKKKKKRKKRNSQLSGSPKPVQILPNFIAQLLVLRNLSLIACTTSEDKTLRVLDLETLTVVKEWALHKRASDICLYNDSTILVGDKFGDVYAYNVPQSDNQKVAETFADGDLLLGHVSLLTAITVASPTSNPSKKYIVTADRDEHLRITHGEKALTHLIYKFCFGHTLFVSRLLLTKQNLLVSGGGDDWVGVWRWDEGRLIQKLEVRSNIEKIFQGDDRKELLFKMERRKRRREEGDGEVIRIAVNGIWEVETPGREKFTDLLVSVEGIPVLLHYSEDPGFGNFVYKGAIRAPGPVLSLAIEASTCYITCDEVENAGNASQIKSFDLAKLKYSEGIAIPEIVSFFSNGAFEGVSFEESETKAVAERLYTVEALRKGFGGAGDDD